VATVRSGESVPDAVTRCGRTTTIRRFELMPFTKEQSVALVESVLGGTLEGLSADVMLGCVGRQSTVSAAIWSRGPLTPGHSVKVDGVWQLRGRAVVPSDLLRYSRIASITSARMPSTPSICWRCASRSTSTTLIELAGEEAVDAAEVGGT